MIKRMMTAALLMVGMMGSALAQTTAIDRSDPFNMVEKAANLAFERFKAEQPQIQKDPNVIKEIVREELLPYVDYRYASLKVIGRNLPKTTSDQRDRFIAVFKNYLVTTYAQAFTQYHDQQVIFERSPMDEGHQQKIASVKARIIEEGRPEINLIFKARLNSKTGSWGVYDMVAEGISLLSSKQAELEGLIRQKGIDEVTQMLKDKANVAITLKKEEKAA
ncbi:ABC transporter substrate-binding protein [Gallaecimonas kandeliae]|uniref:ABC transporter substrate-binding protein n=1 Tax=Gallaecimonas kandeliae TaxID=3029055 RepID=UPI0026494499|nr:ABC transporter substrate-binding protein [Gallaecimonas kandeliae]WKE66056.1 ABC transporter substrate-binding protein [Gallaecimonas kandeliae]